MAEADYRRQLNDYHTELLSVAHLTAHLLDGLIDTNREEWESSGAFLMKEKLVQLAENLPFPGEGDFLPERNPLRAHDLGAVSVG